MEELNNLKQSQEILKGAHEILGEGKGLYVDQCKKILEIKRKIRQIIGELELIEAEYVSRRDTDIVTGCSDFIK